MTNGFSVTSATVRDHSSVGSVVGVVTIAAKIVEAVVTLPVLSVLAPKLFHALPVTPMDMYTQHLRVRLNILQNKI
jgi:hypothetical protein